MDEVWGRGRVELLDEIMVEGVVDHGAEGQSGGRQAVKDAVRMIRGAFPDLQTVESDIVAQGDKVVRRWVNEGTHTGNFLGLAPTGNHIRVTGINIERIVDGRIVEYWHNFDMLGWLEQLGVTVPIQLPSTSSFAGEATE
jgi:predicted ester cyclase